MSHQCYNSLKNAKLYFCACVAVSTTSYMHNTTSLSFILSKLALYRGYVL